MEVRRIRADEWGELRALRLQALQDAPEAFGSTYADESELPRREWRRWAKEGADGGPSYVALAEDAVSRRLGGLAVGAPHDELVDANGLFAMWVAPRLRRQGIGRLLVDAIVTWSSSTDRPRLLLRVTGSNEAAVSLYRSCGFVATGERVPLRPGSPIVTVVMEHLR
jgi:ribosomal protein S18 acetylase RimI-like enzyme